MIRQDAQSRVLLSRGEAPSRENRRESLRDITEQVSAQVINEYSGKDHRDQSVYRLYYAGDNRSYEIADGAQVGERYTGVVVSNAISGYETCVLSGVWTLCNVCC